MFKDLFFDFDGTLADSSEGIYESFKNSCFKLNLEPVSINKFKKFIGPPISDILRKIYPNLSANQISDFKDFFRNDYDNKNFKLVNWYPGVQKGLKILAESGKFNSINVITNKPTKPTITLLKNAKLDSYFNNIYGIDYKLFRQISTKSFINKGEAINFAIQTQKVKTNNALYIGDTNSDLLASKENNIKFVAVNYGFYLWKDIEISKADYTISNFDGLYKLFVE